MSNTEGSTSEPICVLFSEAIAWISDRNFTGAAIGPRPFRLLPFGEEDDEEYRIAEGRCMLAQQLLIDYGAKGRIRIYADDGWAKDEQSWEDMDSTIQLTTEFYLGMSMEFTIILVILFTFQKIWAIMTWPLITLISSESFGAMPRPPSQFGSRLRALSGALPPCAAAAGDLGTPGPISQPSSSADHSTGPR